MANGNSLDLAALRSGSKCQHKVVMDVMRLQIGRTWLRLRFWKTPNDERVCLLSEAEGGDEALLPKGVKMKSVTACGWVWSRGPIENILGFYRWDFSSPQLACGRSARRTGCTLPM